MLLFVYEFAVKVAHLPGGGVPNLQASAAGFGGNWLGLIVALAVPVALILLGIVGIAYSVNQLLAAIPSFANAAAGLSLGGNGGAMYLLYHSFPVGMAITCLVSRFVIPINSAWMYVLGVSASRFLFSK